MFINFSVRQNIFLALVFDTYTYRNVCRSILLLEYSIVSSLSSIQNFCFFRKHISGKITPPLEYRYLSSRYFHIQQNTLLFRNISTLIFYFQAHSSFTLLTTHFGYPDSSRVLLLDLTTRDLDIFPLGSCSTVLPFRDIGIGLHSRIPT